MMGHAFFSDLCTITQANKLFLAARSAEFNEQSDMRPGLVSALYSSKNSQSTHFRTTAPRDLW